MLNAVKHLCPNHFTFEKVQQKFYPLVCRKVFCNLSTNLLSTPQEEKLEKKLRVRSI